MLDSESSGRNPLLSFAVGPLDWAWFLEFLMKWDEGIPAALPCLRSSLGLASWGTGSVSPVSPLSFCTHVPDDCARTVLESTRKLFQFDFQLMGWEVWTQFVSSGFFEVCQKAYEFYKADLGCWRRHPMKAMADKHSVQIWSKWGKQFKQNSSFILFSYIMSYRNVQMVHLHLCKQRCDADWRVQ